MPSWEIDSYITEADIPYELGIAKNPDDISVWLKYYKQKSSQRNLSFIDKTFVLQRAVKQFPRSYKFWDLYLNLLVSNVDDEPLNNELSKFVIASFQDALQLLNKSPILWVKLLQFLITKQNHEITFIRRTFNDALYNLPVSQHHHIWPLYLSFADNIGGVTGSSIYLKFIKYTTPDELKGIIAKESRAPQMTIDQIISKLVEFGDLENSIKLINDVLSNISQYLTLPKSPVQLWTEFIDLIMRINGNVKASTMKFEESDEILLKLVLNGINKFPDQVGIFYSKLIMYYIERKKFDKVRHYSFKSLKECVTVKDFTFLFDMYTEFEQSYILHLESLIEEDPENEYLIQEADFRMEFLEDFIDNRSILLNDMKLRQNPNNLDVWFNRIDIYENEKNDVGKLLNTFVEALTTLNPLKVMSVTNKYKLSDFWIRYTSVYSKSNDIRTASLIYSKAVKSQFKTPDELSNIYISWSEMLLENGEDEESINLIQNILSTVPDQLENNHIDYHDQSLSVQTRIHKSMKLWTFYLDLLESMIEDDQSIEENQIYITKITKGYEQIIELKIANPHTILTFTKFLQDNKYWEKSFEIYELGLSIFHNFKVKFEIWNQYLTSIIKYFQQTNSVSIERIRDLFDQSLLISFSEKDLPPYLTKLMYLLYSQFEQDHGSIIKSITILEKSIENHTTWINEHLSTLSKQDQEKVITSKFEVYQMLIFKVSSILKDDDKLRNVYTIALNDQQLKLSNLIIISSNFIKFETGLKQFGRVRSLFKYITKLSNPSNKEMIELWQKWEKFELQFGNELSFKDMLRFKRSVVDDFKNDFVFKESINPMGFVKSSKSGANSNDTEKESEASNNPDAIDLDMDM